MIYFYYSTIPGQALNKAMRLFGSLRERKPDASFVEMDADSANAEAIASYAQSQGLFEKKAVMLLKNVLGNETEKEEILKLLPSLKTSENIFVWAESKLLKPEIEKLNKFSDKSDVDEEKQEKKEQEFSPFAAAECFGRRDRKGLWLHVVRSMMKGNAPEEMHGMIFWQAKTMALVAHAKNAEEAGQKPFSFSKAKAYLKNYKEGEINKILATLVAIYHEAHRGERALDLALEEFALSI